MFLSVRTVDSKINTIIGTSVITIELFNMYLEKLGNNQSRELENGILMACID